MMIRSILIIATLLLPAAPTAACSFGWRRGHSPAEIRESPALREVRGTFNFVIKQDGSGHIATDARGWAYGRIDAERGRPPYWNTVQFPLSEIAIECGAYTAPTGNGATGTFWISRERRNRRHQLMMWEPAPARDPVAAPSP
jgi:hypothetical protein